MSVGVELDDPATTGTEVPEQSSRWWSPGKVILVAAGGLATAAYGAALVLPLLSGGPGTSSASPPSTCVPRVHPTDPAIGTPAILGDPTLTEAELVAWWETTDEGEPAHLGVDLDELVDLYLREARLEGVQGDLAFAQAVLETGYFSNTDTSINNFAGIGHYDDAASGIAFPDVATGVRAHIQLLKRYARGNDTQLARDEVAPEARASATTWDQLAGTWATDVTYWRSLSRLYAGMLAHADETAPGRCDP